MHKTHSAGPVLFAAATGPERNACARGDPDSTGSAGARFLQVGIGIPSAGTLFDELKQIGPSGLVSTGTAGGLTPGLKPGTVLLPRRVRCVDGAVFDVDRQWHDRVHAALTGHVRVDAGELLAVDTVIRQAKEKRRLHERTHAAAIDMESAALARLAARVGTPYLILRAVMDPADDEVPGAAGAALSVAGELKIGALLAWLARHPGDLRGLARATRNFRIATGALRRAYRLAAGPLLNPDG